jgi:hypothetical protein
MSNRKMLEKLNPDTFDAEGKKKIKSGGNEEEWDVFLGNTLADEFQIRRSTSTLQNQNRDEMIAHIARSADRQVVENEMIVWCDEPLGVVICPVVVKGVRYQNIKVFRLREGRWQCAYWQVTETPVPIAQEER